MNVHIDIEARSRVNLLTEGVYHYAMDASTEVLCVAWAIDDGPVRSWRKGQMFPVELIKLFDDPSTIFYAHNAQFERLLFWYVLCLAHGLRKPDLEQFYCTATQARANALPAHLGDCARCLKVPQQKDKRGEQLIKLLSLPQADGSFLEDESLMDEFVEYCRQDVRTEMAITTNMRELTPAEQRDYWVSERVNDRGIRVDVELAEAVTLLADEEQADINRQIALLTKGKVLKSRSPKMAQWVYARLPDEAKGYMEDTSKKSGLCFDAAVVDNLLQCQLSGDVEEAVKLKAAASMSSVAKFKAMAMRSRPDDHRVRGAFILYGAGQTHRFSSKGLQVHNFPRDTDDDPETTRYWLMDGVQEGLLPKLKGMLRPSIQAAPGCVFVQNDWSGIEARVLPWVTSDPQAEKTLDVFRAGEDIYLVTAAMMDESRLVGKVATLAMGYQGGVGAFQSMAKNYRLNVSDTDAERYKRKWRDANPWAVRFWALIQQQALRAVENPGAMYRAGKVSYVYVAGTLWCILPSGTILSYPDARVSYDDDPVYGPQKNLSCIKASLKPKKGQEDWPRMNLYGGLLTENVVQGIAGDLLRECLTRIEDWSDEVVMHVHDEIIMEVPAAEADLAMEDLTAEMLHIPDWAKGLPLEVSGWIGGYYRKD